MVDVLGQIVVVLGALVFLSAGAGLVRLRDVYARSSAIATAAGLGVSLILVGVFLMNPSWSNAGKLAVAIVLQLVTSAVGSMAIARSAYLTGSPMVGGGDLVDDLADAGDEVDDRDSSPT